MFVKRECRSCLESLARRTAKLAAADKDQEERALKEGLSYLEERFSCLEIPTRIAGEMQRIIRKATSNNDPFLTVKEKEMKIARELAAESFSEVFSGDLNFLIAFAARGNSLDFFLDLDKLKTEMKKPVSFFYDDINALLSLLNDFRNDGDKKILYFADNAGECYFDYPLVEKLEEYAQVTYVVKEKPVQNDLAREDLERSGIREKFKRVMSTGSDTPGLDLCLASSEFKEVLAGADLLMAKGMGYYETLPELSVNKPVFYLFKAKCRPVAESLNVPLDSYIAYLFER